MTKENNLKLSVGTRLVDTEIKKMKVKDLHFYPANPRISSIILDYKGKLDDDTIEKMMWEHQSEATRVLFRRIKEDGNINEPLLVYNSMTIEGNTRLCVARTLLREATEKEKDKWLWVPCRVVTTKLSNEEIDFILCNIHIKKKKDWSPYEQACYFMMLYEQEKMNYSKISKFTGEGINKVSDYITSFKKMREYKESGEGRFNYYFETIRQPAVKKIMRTENPKIDIIKVVKKKIDEGKIKRAQEVRKISTILKDERATKMFFEGDADIKRAEEVALITNPQEGDPFLGRISDLTEDLKHMKFTKLGDIKKDSKKIKIIKELAEQIKKLCHTLKIKF